MLRVQNPKTALDLNARRRGQWPQRERQHALMQRRPPQLDVHWIFGWVVYHWCTVAVMCEHSEDLRTGVVNFVIHELRARLIITLVAIDVHAARSPLARPKHG